MYPTTTVSSWQAWLEAARPRTLPLALASILMGSFLAAYYESFRWPVFWLAALTTILLQILSNLANDYGDSIHGADHAEREGPKRAVQAGHISAASMRRGMYISGAAAFLSGLLLLYIALADDPRGFTFFLVLGVLAIVAAITYTAGIRPYGYAGLGDLSVLIFFGFVGVLGTFYLHVNQLPISVWLPALSCGLFSVAVLNLNNIRDIKSDIQAGKLSIPVRIGRRAAVRYHWILLIVGFMASLSFVGLNYRSPWQLLFLLSLPLFVKNARAVHRYTQAQELDPFLRQMALSTLFFVLLFGLGHWISVIK